MRRRLRIGSFRTCCPNGGNAAVFGFGDWNGRSLTDNAPDVMFSIATNSPVRLGIGKESVTSKPSRSFPYVPAVPASPPQAMGVPGPS